MRSGARSPHHDVPPAPKGPCCARWAARREPAGARMHAEFARRRARGSRGGLPRRYAVVSRAKRSAVTAGPKTNPKSRACAAPKPGISSCRRRRGPNTDHDAGFRRSTSSTWTGDVSLVSGLAIPFNASSVESADVPSGGAFRDFHGGGAGPLLCGTRSLSSSFTCRSTTSDQLVAAKNKGSGARVPGRARATRLVPLGVELLRTPVRIVQGRQRPGRGADEPAHRVSLALRRIHAERRRGRGAAAISSSGRARACSRSSPTSATDCSRAWVPPIASVSSGISTSSATSRPASRARPA